ncbi:MAG: hypothetical protein AB4426_02140 [Xenococcaceae cyanobacterium]
MKSEKIFSTGRRYSRRSLSSRSLALPGNDTKSRLTTPFLKEASDQGTSDQGTGEKHKFCSFVGWALRCQLKDLPKESQSAMPTRLNPSPGMMGVVLSDRSRKSKARGGQTDREASTTARWRDNVN